MTDNPDPQSNIPQAGSTKSAGGVFLAFGCIAGVVIGGLLGQPSIGFLAGLALGGLIAMAVWYADR